MERIILPRVLVEAIRDQLELTAQINRRFTREERKELLQSARQLDAALEE